MLETNYISKKEKIQENEEKTEEEEQRREMQQFQNVVYGNHSSILLHAHNSGSKRT